MIEYDAQKTDDERSAKEDRRQETKSYAVEPDSNPSGFRSIK